MVNAGNGTMERRRKIGVMVESFRLGIRGGIAKAAELGADGFQVYVTSGETAPENMSQSDRKEFCQFVADQGLVISALCADYGKGYLNAEQNKQLIPKTLECIDLAYDLGVNVVTSHIGRLPEDENHPEWRAAQQALTQIGEYSQSKGISFAVETGPESPNHLLKFLQGIPNDGIKINYDPANFAMFGFDQLAGVKILKDYIVHTHAKDGIKGELKEMPLGQGDVDIKKWVSLLDEIGYDGFLTIEREVGEHPIDDITMAIEYLRNL